MSKVKNLMNFNEMQRETESKEIITEQNSALVEAHNKTWGTEKEGGSKDDILWPKQRSWEKVENIDINLLTEFRGKRTKKDADGRKQPFKTMAKNKQDVRLHVKELMESIQTIGLTTPLIVRKKNDKYQILSGHSRFLACKKLGHEKIPCIVRDINDKEAERYVIECNVQRLKLLPSEYGKILERYLDMARDFKEENETDEGFTVKQIASKFNVSKKMMYAYINVNHLEDNLQDQVDMGRVYIDLAGPLGVLTPEQQNKLADLIDKNPKTLVMNTGKKVIAMFQEHNVNEITEEMYNECLKEARVGYKNKVYNNVYKKYDIPADKQIAEEEIDSLVSDFLDDYFGKMFEKVQEKEQVEEQSEDLDR